MRVLLKKPVRQRDERGVITVIVVLLSVVMLVMAAFAVDFGMAYSTKRQLSSASDAASLAADAVYKTEYKGACTVPGNDPNSPVTANASVRADAEAAADSLFTQNYPKGTAVDGTITSVSCKGTGVQVVYSASGKSDSPFGVLAGGSGTITTAGTAAAAYAVGSGICAMCVLGNVNSGNADLTVSGGDIYVNGNVSTGPNSVWTATTSITIAGTGGPAHSKSHPDYTSGPSITDPFADVTLPTAPWTGLTVKSGSPCGGGPGVYGAVALPNSLCTLLPGAYVITGTWSAKNNTVLTSNGQPVTLFFAGPSGMLDLKNGNLTNMVAPSTPPLAGWPAGFVIIYARDNTQQLQLQGNGTSAPDVVGTVYAVKSQVTFNGGSCFVASKGPIVVGGISGNGNTGCVKLQDTANAGSGTPTGLHLTK